MARQPVWVPPPGDHARNIEDVLDRKGDAGKRSVRRSFDLDAAVGHESVQLILHLACPSSLRDSHVSDQAPAAPTTPIDLRCSGANVIFDRCVSKRKY
jgi:hypothetical protein